jgi:DNA-directed RNA polymerase beta subunit
VLHYYLKKEFDADRTVVPISEKSGLVAVEDGYNKKSVCPLYGDDAEVSNIEMSYAFKLFLDEIKALGIYPKLELKNRY